VSVEVQQGTLNSLRVLEEIAARQPVGVTELSKAVDLTKSSTQRVIVSLHAAGWVRPAGSDQTKWELTARALVVGQSYARGGLRRSIMPTLHAVRDATSETVLLGVRDGDEVVVIDCLEGLQTVRVVTEVGSRAKLDDTALGRAVIRTGVTPTDDGPRADEQYIVADNADDSGVSMVAVAAPAASPDVAIALAVPSHRATPERMHQLGALLIEHVRLLSHS
jgi:IclR family acetate operon transcriptional repressor